jgi:hypothetical protein
MLHNPNLLSVQRDKLHHLIRTLNKPGASRNAANLALELMTARASTLINGKTGSISLQAPAESVQSPGSSANPTVPNRLTH